jgi:hypothetical protein
MAKTIRVGTFGGRAISSGFEEYAVQVGGSILSAPSTGDTVNGGTVQGKVYAPGGSDTIEYEGPLLSVTTGPNLTTQGDDQVGGGAGGDPVGRAEAAISAVETRLQTLSSIRGELQDVATSGRYRGTDRRSANDLIQQIDSAAKALQDEKERAQSFIDSYNPDPTPPGEPIDPGPIDPIDPGPPPVDPIDPGPRPRPRPIDPRR